MIKRLFLVGLGVAICFTAVGEKIKDPMRPPDLALKKFRLEKLKKNPPPRAAQKKPAQQSEQWELNSILYSTRRKHAIINNQMVRKGGLVDGARLVSIEPGRVRLVKAGKAISLSLPSRRKTVKKSSIEKKL